MKLYILFERSFLSINDVVESQRFLKNRFRVSELVPNVNWEFLSLLFFGKYVNPSSKSCVFMESWFMD